MHSVKLANTLEDEPHRSRLSTINYDQLKVLFEADPFKVAKKTQYRLLYSCSQFEIN